MSGPRKMLAVAAGIGAVAGGGVVAFLLATGVTSATSCPAGAEALLSKRIVGPGPSYAKDNPAESQKVFTYLNGGARPVITGFTHMGLHLVYTEDLCRPSPPPTTTSTTTTTTVPTTTTTTTTTTTPPPTGTITITAGGTYSGHWSATGTSTAVAVRTSQPVTIQNSVIDHSGRGPLIDANFAGVQLTVSHVTFNGGTGQAVLASGFKSISLSNSTINRTWGIRLNSAQSGATCSITKNKGLNQQYDGVNAEGVSHFFQIAFSPNLGSCDVSWNQALNDYGQTGVTDVFNIYDTANVKMHDNYADGNYEGSSCEYIVDGSTGHHNELYGNQAIDGENCGLAVSGGHDNSIHDNRAISDSALDNGTRLPEGNVGIYINSRAATGGVNNHAVGNTIGWLRGDGVRNTMYFPDTQGDYALNTEIPTAQINHSLELAEWQRWLDKLAANGITIGA